MNIIGNYKFAKQAGLIAIVCSIFQIVYGLLAVFFDYSKEINYGWSEALWIVANIGMIGAIVGILALDAGIPSWLAKVSGIVAIIGVSIRIIAAILIILGSAWYPLPLILLSILLGLVGIFALGITILRGDKITGWQGWTPLIVAIFEVIVAALYSVNLFIHFILLGLWGLSWMLVGYVVISHASDN